MRIRSVAQEYEAQLKPTQFGVTAASAASGKGEWKIYADGSRQCKVWVTGLNLSDGAVIHVAVNGRQVTQLLVRGGRARYRRESERGEAVPEVIAKQLLQMSYAGQIILEGEFYAE